MQVPQRMAHHGDPPTEHQVEEWVGKDAFLFWRHIAQYIEQNYAGVFSPEWLFGGKKFGWSLRYKKGNSFCTFIPERNHFTIMIVFGSKERLMFDEIRNELSDDTLIAYERATTYHDGKWLFLPVDSETAVRDVKFLLGVKRRTKKSRNLG